MGVTFVKLPHRWLQIGVRKSALMTMIVSNLFILLIPLAMGLFLYTKVENSLEKGANRSNKAMLEQLKLTLDNKLSEVDVLMGQITLDSKLDYMLKIPPDADSADKYLFIDFKQNKLSRFRSMVSSFIYDYYVYFAASDTIVKGDMLTDSRTFYENSYTYKSMSYEEWRQTLLLSPHVMTYLPAAELVPGHAASANIEYVPSDVVTYAQSLPIRSQNDVLGNLIILIDVSQIKEMFAQLESASHSLIYIVDNTGRTIMGTSQEPLPADIMKRVNESGEPFDYVMNGVRQMISVTSSQKAGWKYVSVTPSDVFMQQVNTIQNWSTLLFILCLIAGLAAVYAVAYRNYSPIKKTVNAILRGKEMEGPPAYNEYEFIRQTIEGSFHEEKNLRSMLTQQTPVIRANYLSRLVRGYMDVDTAGKDDKTLDFMNISFISDRFVVLLVKIEDISRFSGEKSEQQWALARFIISNIGADLIGQYHKGFAVELDRDRLAFLVNLNPARNEAAAKDVRDITGAFSQVIPDRFKLDITVAAGGIHEGPQSIRDSYPEALAALEYRLVKGSNAIIHFEDITDAKQHYYYPLETEIQLINFVRSGDTDSADRLLDTIYAMNFDSTHITPELGKCLFFNVISTFLKIVNATNMNPKEVLGTDFDPLKEVFSHPTAEGMHAKTKELFRTLSGSFKVERTDHSTVLLQEIVSLVDANLDDPNLGLALVADRFRMTPQYVSTFFKKNQGQNLLDYITRKRIEKAKRLMENKELTNAHIAQMVGYTNDVVFIRAFKKLEGITPGKYRETIKPDPAG